VELVEEMSGNGTHPNSAADPPPVDVLVVDDNKANLLAVEAVLRPLNQNLILKRSGADALRWLLQGDPAVVLLDVRMPYLDGFETAIALRGRERSRHTPVIFITAVDTDAAKIVNGYSMGAVDFLFKPIVPEILRAKVAVFVELHRKRVQVEEQARILAERSKELARSNSELAEFAYAASHDLQEPLRKVVSFSALLKDRLGRKEDGDALENLRVILSAVDRMQKMISDLLELARVGSREPRTHTSLDEALDAALAQLDEAIHESKAVVTRGTLPKVWAPPREVVQLFQNLISNALKFRRDEPPRVHVSAEKSEEGWVVTVRDNGIGIAPDEADGLFQMFRRLHSRADYPGTGMGLAICRKIAELLGGRIWVVPAPEAGSMFRVLFPDRAHAKEVVPAD
jgi:signal transduction histidine kinase